MIKYLLIEDEHFAYEEIRRMIQKIRPDYLLSNWAKSVEQSLLILKQGNIDLIIVDIRLSDGVCFEIFEQYPVDIPLIFTTAYDEYALKAFKLNSLNVLSSLAYQDAGKTNLFTKKLSNVYRYLLTTHERQTVTLEEELLFTDSYLFLEQIRFGEALQVSINNNGKNQHKSIIPASIQLLVENAIKHNISTNESPLIIHVKVETNGVTVSNNLQLRNYVTQNGMGLNNLKKQYSLYKQEINIVKTETNFTVKLPFIEL